MVKKKSCKKKYTFGSIFFLTKCQKSSQAAIIVSLGHFQWPLKDNFVQIN